MKQTPRTRKVNEMVREAIAIILSEEVADPRLELVTVTSAEVSPDLSVAKIFVITHGGEERYTELLEGLESASGRIRSLLGSRISLRFTPELRFVIDRSVDEGMRISEALKDVPPTLREEREGETDAGTDE